MKLFTAEEMPKEKLTRCQNYIYGAKKVKTFQNNCIEATFISLFCEEEGKRLWKIYVTKCNRQFNNLLECLTDEQRNTLYVQLFMYENLAKELL